MLFKLNKPQDLSDDIRLKVVTVGADFVEIIYNSGKESILRINEIQFLSGMPVMLLSVNGEICEICQL